VGDEAGAARPDTAFLGKYQILGLFFHFSKLFSPFLFVNIQKNE